MSAKKLAALTVAAGANGQVVYTVNVDSEGGKLAVNLLNSTGTDATVKVALTTGSSPAATDYIENGATIKASGGVLFRDNLDVSPGEKLHITTTQDLVVRVTGEEYQD